MMVSVAKGGARDGSREGGGRARKIGEGERKIGEEGRGEGEGEGEGKHWMRECEKCMNK